MTNSVTGQVGCWDSSIRRRVDERVQRAANSKVYGQVSLGVEFDDTVWPNVLIIGRVLQQQPRRATLP